MPGRVCLASSATRPRTACRSLSPSFIRPSSAKATSGSSGVPVMTGSSAHRPSARSACGDFRVGTPAGALHDRDSGRDRRRAVHRRRLAASRRQQPQDSSLSAPSPNGYPGRGPAARPGSRARLLEVTVTSSARPGPAYTPSGYDHIRPGPARSGACDPAQFSAGTLVLHVGTPPPRGTGSAQGWSGPPAAQRAHPADSRT